MSGQAKFRGDSRLSRVVHVTTEVLAFLSILCIAFILLATVADVTRRAISGKSIQGVTELGEVVMVAIVFLGLGFAESRGAHVSMTLLIGKLRPNVAAIVNGLGLLLVVAIVGWMLYVTADRALASVELGEYRFGLARIPVWPARVAIAVGIASYTVQLVFRLVKDVQAARGKVPGPLEQDAVDSTPLI